MGVKIPLTCGQLRIFFVILFFFAAIKVVLYQSVSYETFSTTTARQESEAERETTLSTKNHISLKSRWKPRGRFVRVEGSDKSERTGESKHRRARYSDGKTLDGFQRKAEGVGLHTRTVKSLNQLQVENLDTSNSKADTSTNMAGKEKSDHGFDAEIVLQLFQKCRGEDGDLLIECYNDAYEELCKLFKPLGTIFNFVTSDIVEKIGILRDYQKSEVGEHFRSIQSMVKYEVSNDLTNQKKKASGCRTLLRLHRALEFIAALLTKIRNTDNSCKFSNEATEAYDSTLAKYHPWLIKKAVHVAMYTLPDRKNLLLKMTVEDTPEGMAKVEALIGQLNMVYDVTQKLYIDNNLLDLP